MISVIVPVYNAEKWLDKCVESIINQTYKDIEILLINDGSKDKSLEICRKYETIDSRIRVFDKKNEGVSKARNLGLYNARGKYVQFVDSDDFIEPDMCEKLLDAITNADMAICGIKIYKNDKVLKEHHIKHKTYNLRKRIDYYFELRKINLGPCNKLYIRSLIDEQFMEDLTLGADTMFVLNYMKNVTTVTSVSKCLYNVRLDNDKALNKMPKTDKVDSLIEQRKAEENFLKSIYGPDCELKRMYELYLKLIHSCFFDTAKNNKKLLKQLIAGYTNHSLLLEKIRKAQPKRIDYIVFKFLYINNLRLLMFVYFKLKVVLLKRI